ncbi:MAG TPA: 30S ribosomal protein S4e [Nautiliaceae bacterium]|nr:30S ribosomal protein S4e [Nautiliaceae bacterium]
MKRHMKRLAMPKTWPFPRKEGGKFVTRPNPRASFLLGLPLREILKYNLEIAKNSKEAEFIIRNKKVLVNGKPRKNGKFLVVLFDVISLPEINKHYRLVFGKNKKLTLIEIPEEEANIKVLNIINKHKVKGDKIQLTMHDSTNLQFDNTDLRVDDSIVYNFKEKKIESVIKMKEGAYAYIYKGKNIGKHGKIKRIIYDQASYKKLAVIEDNEGKEFSTILDNLMVIGEEKPVITIE